MLMKQGNIKTEKKLIQLTPKQEKFCQEYVKTGNKSEAYRLAYSADGMTNESINVSASRMQDNPKITLRIQELQKRIEQEHEINIDWCISQLKAIVIDNDKDRVGALDKLMKHLGGYEKNNFQKTPTFSILDSNLTEEEKDQLFDLSLKMKLEYK